MYSFHPLAILASSTKLHLWLCCPFYLIHFNASACVHTEFNSQILAAVTQLFAVCCGTPRLSRTNVPCEQTCQGLQSSTGSAPTLRDSLITRWPWSRLKLSFHQREGSLNVPQSLGDFRAALNTSLRRALCLCRTARSGKMILNWQCTKRSLIL